MSLNKGIEHKKEKRKPYMWEQNLWTRLVGTMGSCDYCKSNRLYKFKKDEPAEPLFDLDTGFIGGLLADEITSRFQVAVKNAIERNQKNNLPKSVFYGASNQGILQSIDFFFKLGKRIHHFLESRARSENHISHIFIVLF